MRQSSAVYTIECLYRGRNRQRAELKERADEGQRKDRWRVRPRDRGRIRAKEQWRGID